AAARGGRSGHGGFPRVAGVPTWRGGCRDSPGSALPTPGCEGGPQLTNWPSVPHKLRQDLSENPAVAVLRHTHNRTTKDAAWVRGLLARKPTKVAAVALANK